jgi:hypothetical protein
VYQGIIWHKICVVWTKTCPALQLTNGSKAVVVGRIMLGSVL